MKFLFYVSVLMLVICLQGVIANDKEYIRRFVGTNRGIGRGLSNVLLTTQNCAVLMITPKFKKEKLEVWNQKLQKKKEKPIDQQLSWDLDNELVSFILLPIATNEISCPAVEGFKDFKITNELENETFCSPVETTKINFSRADVKYLFYVYGLGVDGGLGAYKISYKPDCLVQDSVSEYLITYNFGRYIFKLDFALDDKVKNIIKSDFKN